jgi:hypothetical protein
MSPIAAEVRVSGWVAHNNAMFEVKVTNLTCNGLVQTEVSAVCANF